MGITVCKINGGYAVNEDGILVAFFWMKDYGDRMDCYQAAEICAMQLSGVID